jgi:hypothetical protein
MKRNIKAPLLAVLLVACIGIQIPEQIYSARLENRRHSLSDKAWELQKAIDRLESEGAQSSKIAAQRKALGETMTQISQTFDPHLLPVWLRGASSVGALLIVVALWRMRRKPGDTEPGKQEH